MRKHYSLKSFIERLTAAPPMERLLARMTLPKYSSTEIDDPSIIDAFTRDHNNAFLISFPRTGSHWLRMLMELYFGRPSLVRVFYYPERKDYLTLHTHDLDLDVERSNVIYLYRDPVDTIYSQLRYYNEDIEDRERVTFWTDLYGRHLNKWLHQENFSKLKSIVQYEGLKRSPHNEFRKICNHFGQPLDAERFDTVLGQVSKKRVKKKTHHDRQVINLSNTYTEKHEHFVTMQGEFVWQVLLNGREHLKQNFLNGNHR